MKKLVILSFIISIVILSISLLALSRPDIYKTPDLGTPMPIPVDVATPTILPSTKSTPEPTPNTVTISFAGDVMFDSWVGSLIDKEGPNHIISGLKGIFKKSDISVVNLETPISVRGKKEKDKQFTFRSEPEYIKVLTEAGINMVTLANNHILDFGPDAFADTIDILKANQIGYIGAGQDIDEASRPLYITKNECRIAFIASSHVIPFISWTAGPKKPGVASTYDPSRLLSEIENAKKNADIVVVYIHWGEEMNTKPVPYQKNLARMYIDKGADIVVGSHPHILQGIELYKNGVICYSLGNFIFTNTKKDTMIVNIELRDKKISSVRVIPCEINNFRTTLIEGNEKSLNIIKYLESISFGVNISPDGSIVLREFSN